MKIRFTREDARRMFDLLPKGEIHQDRIEGIFEKRFALVRLGRGYSYAWLDLPHEAVIGFLDVNVRNYYEREGNKYKKLGVIKGTDLLYREVNFLIQRQGKEGYAGGRRESKVDRYVEDLVKELKGRGLHGGMLALKVRQGAMDKFGGSSSQMGTTIKLNIKGQEYEYDINKI